MNTKSLNIVMGAVCLVLGLALTLLAVHTDTDGTFPEGPFRIYTAGLVLFVSATLFGSYWINRSQGTSNK